MAGDINEQELLLTSRQKAGLFMLGGTRGALTPVQRDSLPAYWHARQEIEQTFDIGKHDGSPRFLLISKNQMMLF